MANDPRDPHARAAPAYVSYATFVTFLDWLRELRSIPSQFDRTWWGPKFSGSTGTQLMSGLRFLGLLENNTPTPDLERLASGTDRERKVMLRGILTRVYGSALVDALPHMTPRMLNEALDALGTTAATRAKARSFFVNAAKAAELELPSGVANQRRRRSESARGGLLKQENRMIAAARERTAHVEPDPAAQSAGLPARLHPALVPLLADLEEIGPRWDSERRARWKKTWDAVLEYAYPVEGEDAAE